MQKIFFSVLALSLALSSLVIAPSAAADATSASRPPPRNPENRANPLAADKVEDALSAIRRARDDNSMNKAIADMQRLVDEGDARAAMRLGRYFHLEARTRDYARAMKLYQVAAANGDGWAINNIGLLYEEGRGVPADLAKAADYFRQAADRGEYHGFQNMARLHFTGTGVKQDPQRAQSWLDKGMKKGLKESYSEAASIYHYGRYGMPVDYTRALRYYEGASEHGDTDSAWYVAKFNLDGIGTPINTAKAIEIYERLAAQNDADALNSLGAIYSAGKGGIAVDKRKAVGYWEQAVAIGQCTALRNLGDAYDRGWGVPADPGRATDYMIAAAECPREQPDGLDAWKLSIRYRDGLGVARDCKKAEELLQQAAAQGQAGAFATLGHLYQHGCDEIEPDLAASFRTNLFGAKLGCAPCQNNVGAMLKHGYGVDAPDRIKAFAWLTLAMENSDGLAKQNLEEFSAMFTAQDRRKGLEHLQVIKQMIIAPDKMGKKTMTMDY